MKDKPNPPAGEARDLTVGWTTGRTGRLIAFSIDLTVAGVKYWQARLRGRRPW